MNGYDLLVNRVHDFDDAIETTPVYESEPGLYQG